VPGRHWRSYGTDPLPSPAEALAEPFRAFPSSPLLDARDHAGDVGKPTRGAVGDGLRVCLGYLTATRGRLVVETAGIRVGLEPEIDGTSRVVLRESERSRTGGSAPHSASVLRTKQVTSEREAEKAARKQRLSDPRRDCDA
jgi:hypothetical protein